MSWTEATHVDGDALARTLAASLSDTIRDAVKARGRALLALAGGRTPFPIYRRLADQPLPWDRVTLLCTDERWVAEDHPARNERELAAAFADADGVRLLSLVPARPGANPDPETALASLGEIGTFDLVLLGMGGDGHTASLFPNAAQLLTALDPRAPPALVVLPQPLPPEAPFARVSLSLTRLLDTRRLLLLATGSAKREVMMRAQAEESPRSLPVAALLHHPQAQVEIHWSP